LNHKNGFYLALTGLYGPLRNDQFNNSLLLVVLGSQADDRYRNRAHHCYNLNLRDKKSILLIQLTLHIYDLIGLRASKEERARDVYRAYNEQQVVKLASGQ
jgi:hypothetical protein